MSSYSLRPRRKRWAKLVAICMVCGVVALIVAVAWARRTYYEGLKPVSAAQHAVIVQIPMGSSLKEIGVILSDKQLIRNRRVFEQYVRAHNLQNKLQAGTYSLRPNQSVQEIVTVLTQGRITADLMTILPGQRIDQIRQAFVDAGFDAVDVQAALDPATYQDHPALVDKPTQANLEGYLYPESFQKTDQTKPQEIVRASLDQMQKRLTPDVRSGIVKQGLTVHEGVILASIIEQEVSKPEDKSKVAQVFLKRLKTGMKLESDATAPYGAILDNKEPSLTYESPYNTYVHAGLPPGPISNVSEGSLHAVASPAPTDWLYFVSGDDGVTYFSNTIEEHEAYTAQHCKKLCNQN